MKIRITLIAIMLSFGFHSNAQVNIATMSPNPAFASESSFLNPAYLKNVRGFQLNIGPLMGANINFGNNFESFGNMYSYVMSVADSGRMNSGPIHALMDNLKPENTLWFHTDLTLLHANFTIGRQENAINLGFSARQHIHAKLSVNDEFFKLIYQGNKQFAGETASFSPRINAIAYTDFGIAASKTISINDFQITPAFRVRYLLGNAAIQTNQLDFSLFTEEDGEYLELDAGIDVNTGGIDFDSFNNNGSITGGFDNLKSLYNGFGTGIGLDLGLAAEYKNISLSLGLVDMGSISFKESSSWNISGSESIYWDGYDIVAEYEGGDPTGFKDILDDLGVDTVKQSFRTGIGSKITFSGNYGIKESEDSKGNKYYIHNTGLSYIQGLSNEYNNSTKPYYAVYYQFNFKNRFSAGVNVNGYDGLTDFGFNLGAKVAGVKLGIGSSSLMTLINTNSGKQFNLFFMLGLAFEKSRKKMILDDIDDIDIPVSTDD